MKMSASSFDDFALPLVRENHWRRDIFNTTVVGALLCPGRRTRGVGKGVAWSVA